MKNIISTCVFLFVLSVFGLASCKFGVNNHKEATNYDTAQIDYEISKLTNEAELDFLATRGDSNIVDWQLSKEFAQLWLEESIIVKK